VLVLAKACGGDGDVATTSGGETSETATAPTSLDVVASDYVGRPVRDVRTELEGLGLRVEVVRSAGGGAVGTVKGVHPTGSVEAGSLVTLDAVAAQPGQDEGDDEDDDDKKKPGKGKGNGKGKDD
jgi:hypothetical protein